MTLKHAAEWTDDCAGKKDFDTPLVVLSTRYWPRGGSWTTFQRVDDTVVMQDRSDLGRQQRIPPSAKAAICLVVKSRYGNEEYVDLATQEFEAETEAEVMQHVEAWAAVMATKVYDAVIAAFDNGNGPGSELPNYLDNEAGLP